MVRLVALLSFLIAVPAAGATTPDIAVNQPVTVEQATSLVVKSEIAATFRDYGQTPDDQIRLLIIADRPAGEADLALARDGSLWMVKRGAVTRATDRDLAQIHMTRIRLLGQLQARKIRPIALRLPASWFVTRR